MTDRAPRLFVSYRRVDAQDAAGRLFDWLRDEFGREQVFLYTADIPYGADFERVVAERIDWCDAVLVVVGPIWATLANEKGRRLDQHDDPVRFELERALAADRRVLIVCVGGAAHPGADKLPASLRALATRNSAPLRAESFDSDFDNLLDELLGRRRGRLRVEVEHLRRLVASGAGGALTALLAVPAIALAAWVGLFDVVGIDTAVQGRLLALAGPPPGGAVRLVAQDAASEQALSLRADDIAQRGAWRRHHARLLDRAAQARAQAVVLDMTFEHPSDGDEQLAAAAGRAIASGTRVVVGALRAGTDALSSPLRAIPGLQAGHVCLQLRAARPAVALAALGAGADALRVARAPALALAAVEGAPLVSADVERRVLGFTGPLRAEPWSFGALESAHDEQRCEALRQAQTLAMLPVRLSAPGRWSAPPDGLRYAAVLDAAQVPDAELAGRILVVGRTQTLSSHLDRHAVAGSSWNTRLLWGVELQADAIATLSARPVPRVPTADMQAGTALANGLAGVLLSAALFRRPRWQRLAAVVGLAAAWLALVAALAAAGLLLQPGYDLMALVVGYGVARWLQHRARASRGLRGLERRQKEQAA